MRKYQGRYRFGESNDKVAQLSELIASPLFPHKFKPLNLPREPINMSSNSEESGQNPYEPSQTDSSGALLSGKQSDQGAYWSKSLKIVKGILFLWAAISLGCGILFRDLLDSVLPSVGGAPFGFWMAQQGSIIGFLVLLFVYMLLMNRLDRQYGFGDEDKQ